MSGGTLCPDAQRVREILRELMLTDPDFAIALRAFIRDEIAAEHREAFGVFAEPALPLDHRHTTARDDEAQQFTGRGGAVRIGVKGLGAHYGEDQ